MNLAHRITLDPTKAQEAYFRRACGTRRFVWNEALRAWNEQFAEAAKAAKSVETKGLTKAKSKKAVKTAVQEVGGWPSGAGLKKAFNEFKYEAYPWLAEVHRDAHSQPFADLQEAFVRYRKGLAKKPQFKKKGRCRDSFYVANDRFWVDGKAVCLPIVGRVRMQEALRFTGKITSATVSRTAGKWFVSISVETETPRPVKLRRNGTPRLSAQPLKERNTSVGVDLGLTRLATLSTGETIEAPKPLKQALGKLRRENRAQARKLTVGRQAHDKHYRSSNWKKGTVRLAKIHAHIARIRLDFSHKLTTRLCRQNQAIGVESLNVKGMLANRCLSRSISDVAWGEILRQFSYKSEIYDTRLVAACLFYPSSKTCWCCGAVKSELTLKERQFDCPCGWSCDRDKNAALNLEDLTYPGLPGKRRLWTGRIGTSASAEEQPSLVEAGTNQCPLVGTN